MNFDHFHFIDRSGFCSGFGYTLTFLVTVHLIEESVQDQKTSIRITLTSCFAVFSSCIGLSLSSRGFKEQVTTAPFIFHLNFSPKEMNVSSSAKLVISRSTYESFAQPITLLAVLKNF